MLKKALALFASISHETEIHVHKHVSVSDMDAFMAHEAQRERLNAMEKLAADLVEEISGSRPEFFDQGGFMDGGIGVITFKFAGLEFDFDGKEMTLV